MIELIELIQVIEEASGLSWDTIVKENIREWIDFYEEESAIILNEEL